MFSLTRSLKNSISQLVKPFLIWDHQFSILLFEIDNPCLWASSDIRDKYWIPAIIPFSVPVCSKILWAKFHFLHCLSIKICRNYWNIVGSWDCLPNILWEKPSTQPCIGKPYGFSVSYTSACQQKFGPTDTYCLRLRRCAFRFSLPSGSSSLSTFITT